MNDLRLITETIWHVLIQYWNLLNQYWVLQLSLGLFFLGLISRIIYHLRMGIGSVTTHTAVQTAKSYNNMRKPKGVYFVHGLYKPLKERR